MSCEQVQELHRFGAEPAGNLEADNDDEGLAGTRELRIFQGMLSPTAQCSRHRAARLDIGAGLSAQLRVLLLRRMRMPASLDPQPRLPSATRRSSGRDACAAAAARVLSTRELRPVRVPRCRPVPVPRTLHKDLP